MTITMTRSSRNVPLASARAFAGLLGLFQLAGAGYFLLLAPEEAVWVGPWLDVPLVATMLCGFTLKLALAVLPGLPASTRIRAGFLAVSIGMAVTLVKIPVYDEPEGVLFLAVDAVLLALLVLARRTHRFRDGDGSRD